MFRVNMLYGAPELLTRPNRVRPASSVRTCMRARHTQDSQKNVGNTDVGITRVLRLSGCQNGTLDMELRGYSY
jgi:hypothetical protein